MRAKEFIIEGEVVSINKARKPQSGDIVIIKALKFLVTSDNYGLSGVQLHHLSPDAEPGPLPDATEYEFLGVDDRGNNVFKYKGLKEGGWEDTITQKTKLNPAVVKAAMGMVKKLTSEFNHYLESQGELPIKMGHPVGSTAYYNVDKPDAEYGDIDMQMIAPDLEGMTAAQITKHYNTLLDQFISSTKPSYLYDKGKPTNGHPIFNLGDDTYVQVDMLWSPQSLSHWNRWRMTPMQGIKGLITGNLYSTLGEIIDMSIQSGVLVKIKDGQPINYQRGRNPDEVVTVSKNIEQFGVDILKYVYNAVNGTLDGIKVDPELQKYPGLKTGNVQVTDLVHTVKGLAKSFEDNDLYGKHVLSEFMNEDDFINTYLKHYQEKAEKAGTGAKLDKAKTPAEKAKVQELRDKIAKGLKIVQQAFAER